MRSGIFLKHFLFISLILSCSHAIAVTELQEIQRIAKTGAIDLALHIIHQQQDSLKDKPDTWIQWEQERIRLLGKRRDWQVITERLKDIPAFSTAEHIIWSRTQRAQALIALGEGTQAREELRKLIWNAPAEGDVETRMAEWRNLIIQSYLSDGLADDAQTATLRYRQEYTEQDKDVLLRARIAILNNNTEEAVELLKKQADDPRAGALLLLAQLRGQTRSAKKVMQAALRHLRNKKIDDELRINLWAVASEAGQRAGQSDFTANALEHVLVEKKLLSLPKAIISIDSNMLWNAYIEYALMLGNRNHLLIGQDDKWIKHAESIVKKHPVGARSMYSFVMLRGKTAQAREKAASRLVELVSKRRHGKRLLQALFVGNRYFPKRSDIPVPAKHVLVDIALANADIDLASELMAGIKEPPPGSDKFMWQLRRARILVLGTQIKAGIEALHRLLADKQQMEQLQVDRFMQVIFDLQTAGEHEAAYQLFDKIMTRTSDEKVQREIYFWMADSSKAMEKYADAARLYLKSAMHPDPENMDPWAQTAHYQAAVALSKAGMYEDAQVLFEFLLRVTEEPARRAVLKSELQKLWAKH